MGISFWGDLTFYLDLFFSCLFFAFIFLCFIGEINSVSLSLPSVPNYYYYFFLLGVFERWFDNC